MRRYVFLLMTGLLSLTSMTVTGADTKTEAGVESAALRCSAISLMHSTLTTPSPQFGEVMGEIAGLYAQVYAVQHEARTKQKLNNAELRKRRDGVLTEISKGWPKNKTAVVRDAALCNIWRIDFFSKLSEKPSEKEFQTALASLGPPPATVSKPEIDKWNGLTPQAVGIWAKIQLQTSQKK
ncbi:MAG: hypothetical protein LW731_07340 [Oxalobacteraceae bacterium]|jgi:hypothetical protein|nr:hypothetical protein [Oxalobacteraceae bacterium]